MSEKRNAVNFAVKFGFIASPRNVQLRFGLVYKRIFSNKTMKPSRLKKHLSKMHSDKFYFFIRRKFFN